MYSIFMLMCAISPSHGIKINVHGEMSVGSNAAGLLSKMLQVSDGDNPQNQQSKDGIRNKPLQQMPDGESKGEKGTRSDYRFPWYSWYAWYDEYKKHKHGSGHKHHKKHRYYDMEYYYSSYEDDYKKHVIIPSGDGHKKHIVIPKDSGEGGKKHVVIPKDSSEGGKKHVVIPKDSSEGGKKHVVIPKDSSEGGKKHIVIPKESGEEKKKRIVIPKNDDDSNERDGVFPGIGSMIWGKNNERIQRPDSSQEDEQHNDSRDGKRWKPPQYGSGEDKKGYDQGYDGMEDRPSAHGFLRQLWNMYKKFREKESINLF